MSLDKLCWGNRDYKYPILDHALRGNLRSHHVWRLYGRNAPNSKEDMMRKAIFWANVLLNVAAIGASIAWCVSSPGLESIVSALAILASTGTLLSAKDYWYQPSSGNVVVQTSNRAGGDIAAGNISKKSSAPK